MCQPYIERTTALPHYIDDEEIARISRNITMFCACKCLYTGRNSLKFVFVGRTECCNPTQRVLLHSLIKVYGVC